ncbi:hypothetical protein HMSSN036_54890 [Paenibacillus macerans]|nr:hypothetical protein HMSSN036_54890 [Paenibacillus macerans]
MNAHVQEVREKPFGPDYGKGYIPHDEAFKKLLQTFFAEFIALFFPELANCSITARPVFLCRSNLLTWLVKKRERSTCCWKQST